MKYFLWLFLLLTILHKKPQQSLKNYEPSNEIIPQAGLTPHDTTQKTPKKPLGMLYQPP
jgi:hypothetical protein